MFQPDDILRLNAWPERVGFSSTSECRVVGFSVPIPKNPGKEVVLLQPGVDDVLL